LQTAVVPLVAFEVPLLVPFCVPLLVLLEVPLLVPFCVPFPVLLEVPLLVLFCVPFPVLFELVLFVFELFVELVVPAVEFVELVELVWQFRFDSIKINAKQTIKRN